MLPRCKKMREMNTEERAKSTTIVMYQYVGSRKTIYDGSADVPVVSNETDIVNVDVPYNQPRHVPQSLRRSTAVRPCTALKGVDLI
jgi:hypothetical protein